MRYLATSPRRQLLRALLPLMALGGGALTPARAATKPLRLTVMHPPPNAQPQFTYFYDLLQLVMRKTEASHGPYVIEYYNQPISIERALVELDRGGPINLVWTGTSVERERDWLPVRISLLAELNNYRLLMIRAGEQARFDHVRTLDDLRKLTAGLGNQWPDTDNLRYNRMPVTTAMHHAQLFDMLALKRFDYFPRGVYEVFNEAVTYRHKKVVVEERLMLYYFVPFYYFVGKKNAALAERLETGLKRAIADGSFDQLLRSIPEFARGLQEVETSKRRLLVLASPLGGRPPPRSKG